jgi:hypothetical protein
MWGRGFWGGNMRERDPLKDPGIDGKTILKCNFRKLEGGMDRIDLTQNRGRWRALVNAVMNFRFHKLWEIS